MNGRLPKYWTTKEHVTLKINEMETSHIINCIKLLKANPDFFAIGFGGVDVDDMFYDPNLEETQLYIQAFNKELNKRTNNG